MEQFGSLSCLFLPATLQPVQQSVYVETLGGVTLSIFIRRIFKSLLDWKKSNLTIGEYIANTSLICNQFYLVRNGTCRRRKNELKDCKNLYEPSVENDLVSKICVAQWLRLFDAHLGGGGSVFSFTESLCSCIIILCVYIYSTYYIYIFNGVIETIIDLSLRVGSAHPTWSKGSPPLDERYQPRS